MLVPDRSVDRHDWSGRRVSTRRGRVRRLCLRLAVIVLGVAMLGTPSIPPGREVAERQRNKGHNAAWLGVEWVNGERTMSDTIVLADDLARWQIKYIFVFVSYMKPNGMFSPTYSHAADFVRVLKNQHPDLNVQAWIGLPLKSAFGSGYVDLGSVLIRSRVISLCADMVYGLGFDGVHLDPEPVVDGDTGVLMLLDELRESGATGTLSMATRRIWPLPNLILPFVGQFAWLTDYYREIARRVDQIAIMTYDSGLPLPCLYRNWVRTQLVQVSRAVSDLDVELFVGVPTSEERTFTHRPKAESLAAGLQGVVEGLDDPNARPSAVSGVAIYPYWEMDSNKWATYQSLWLDQ